MSADTDTSSSRPNGVLESEYDHIPSTPPDVMAIRHLSQQSIPSTEGPNSPIDPSSSFKPELNDDHNPPSSQVIPSSLTPPPSSQVPQTNGAVGMPLGYISSQRPNILSPPATTLRTPARDGHYASDFVAPMSDQIADFSAEELRLMLQTCLAENAKLKMETAHHKLQYNLLSIRADEDAKRAEVEHDMTRREVEVLRTTENSRQARRELNAATESTQIKYRELQLENQNLARDNEVLAKRLKSATKIIQKQGVERDNLIDERDMLLNRIRENREHFQMLCSPGGVFHGAMTPKAPSVTSPQQHRATPRQTPKATHRDVRHDNDTNQAGFAALLEALSHDNSAPSTPTSANRPTLRGPPRHTRGVQSLSSLPTTPTSRARGDYSALLPSVNLVPQTEPPKRYGNSRFALDTSVQKRGRQSRESTISEDDNEELARAALESVAAATQSYMSQGSQASRRRDEEEEVLESQASQAASEMLRRDPRESFEVASSVGSRDGTPAPAEKSAKLQSKLFAGLNKAGLASEKRKLNDGADNNDNQRENIMNATKKMRYGNGSEANGRVGLGIRYGQEA
ncbi:hypothetical protein F4804DRAFT_320830 [Jackrogersella minutella]|nr:hypothetical protein F4804DRAFT_320830 [Jackrogersella minutella]